jgi:hypothetical protein
MKRIRFTEEQIIKVPLMNRNFSGIVWLWQGILEK